MNNFKNLLIALLTGLLALTLSTQQSSGAGSSAAAKAIEYDHCLYAFQAGTSGSFMQSDSFMNIDRDIKYCAKYKP